MAVALSNVLTTVTGARRKTVYEVTMDNSYPTGGESVTASDLGFGVGVDYAKVWMKTPGSTTVNLANFYYNTSTAKILCFDETPAEIANAADLTGVVLVIEAEGH